MSVSRPSAGVGAGLPPFLPPVADGVSPPPSGPLRAPTVHAVFLPPAGPPASDGGEAPLPWIDAFLARPDDMPPASGDADAEGTWELPDEDPDAALERALASIREVVDDLRAHAGEASAGRADRATWFSPRPAPGGGRDAAGRLAPQAEEAARRLEAVARRVREGQLPLPALGGPMRDASSLALALAALHGVRPARSATPPP